MAPLRLSVAVLAALVSLYSPARAQEALLTHSVWFQRAEDRKLSDKRIYRRFAVTPTGDMPNVELFTCPRDPKTYVHVSFEMRKVRNLKDDFGTVFEKFEGRFLVNGKNAFSIPGEVIKSEMFFDRTPQTYKEFDAVIGAEDVVLLFGTGNAGVKIVRASDLSTKMAEFFKTAGVGPMKPFTSAEVLQDCFRYRGVQ